MALGSLLGGFAGGAIGTAVVQLVLDGRQYQTQLAQAEALGKTSTASMSKSMAAFRATAGLAFAAAGIAAVQFAAASVKAASDQEEALNKTRVVFEESSAAVERFADTSAASFGISKTAALDAASGFGTMLQTAGLTESTAASMSVSLTELAADLASFNNIAIEGADGALAKLRSGLAGEAEPLRRLGILLSEARVKAEAYASGIAETGAELTEGQKVQARYNLILQDSAKAQGDFARTSDGLANQQRILQARFADFQAEVGQNLLPVIQELLPALLDIGETALPILKGAIEGATSVIGPMAEALRGVSDVLQGDILPGMDGWTERLRTVTGVFGFMNPALDQVNKGFEEYDKAVAEAAEESTRLSENQAALAANHAVLTGAVGDTGKAIRTFAGRSGEELEEFRDSMQDTFRVGSTTFEELADKARVSANQILASLRKQVKAQENYQENLEELKQRNIPDALLEQLTALGLDGAAIIEALANANKQRFREIVSEWRTSETNAQQIANAIAGIGQAVNNLPTNKTVNVHFNVTSTVGAALSNVAAQVDDAIRAALARTGGA
jgi:predicted DNA-binding protein YlxM (UPF0122 family)